MYALLSGFPAPSAVRRFSSAGTVTLSLLLSGCLFDGRTPSTQNGTTGSPVTASAPAPAPLIDAQRAALPTSWKVLALGAGGFITGINLNPDGVTRVIRTDTYGAYIWRTTGWQQLVTSESMPEEDRVISPNGVVDIVSAPSNPQRLYMYYRDRIYRSDNQGGTWARTAFPAAVADPNGRYRTGSQYIAVDPANSAVLHVGTPRNGLWQSRDAGAS